jgi:hypothetical protein
MRDDLLAHGINLHMAAYSEHVPYIERQIRVLKERARAVGITLPFKVIQGPMIIEMFANLVLWINMFPPSRGVSNTFSPRTIMTETALDFNKHYQIPFGAYAEVHVDRDTTNTMSERTKPAICLGPTANFQVSYKLLSLRTGKRITQKQFKEFPMSDSIIKRVEAMAIREKQDKTTTFGNRSGEPIHDLHASPDTNGPKAAAGVNDGSDADIGNNYDDNDDDNDGDSEIPGITIEQNEISNEEQNEVEGTHEDSEYRGIPGVTDPETLT